jgi:hypothetical protein
LPRFLSGVFGAILGVALLATFQNSIIASD